MNTQITYAAAPQHGPDVIRQSWRFVDPRPAVQNLWNAQEVRRLVGIGQWTDGTTRPQKAAVALCNALQDELVRGPRAAYEGVHIGGMWEAPLAPRSKHPGRAWDSPLNRGGPGDVAQGRLALVEARMKATRLDVPRHLEKHRKTLLREVDKLLKDVPPEVRFADLA
jgi:hypothetical protein